MNPRSPLSANVRIPYKNGVLFFANTENKFNLLDFFVFTTGLGDPIVLDGNRTMDVVLSNKPFGFNQIEGARYSYDPQFQTTGHIMNLEFIYTETYYPPENLPEVIIRLYARTELKIVVI